jgi:hypothetical protein
MTNTLHVLPATERKAEDHSFVVSVSTSSLFTGWGPRL